MISIGRTADSCRKVFLAAAAIGACWFLNTAPAWSQCTTYTTDADFDRGVLDGVNHDAPNSNQLQLSPTVTTFPFAWIANSADGTLSKVSTTTGKEVARYFTGPNHAGGSPSRTAVDRDGNCWVANRAFSSQGSVTQVLVTGGIDRNGNGTIETSTDLNDDGIIQPGEMLPWGQDERVARFYEVGAPANAVRALTIDKAGFLWVGLYFPQRVVKFDPALDTSTYAPAAAASPPELVSIDTATTYGLATAPNGRLYLATLSGVVQEIDPGAASLGTDPPRVLQSFNHGGMNYGIAVDQAGIVWLADAASSRCVRWDPALGGAGFSTGVANGRGRGITVDFDGNIWMALDVINQVVKFAPTNPPTALFHAPAGCTNPIGIGTAADGQIITVGYLSNSWGKIDKDTGATIATGGPQQVGNGPYTYSDFTGSLSAIIGRQGFFTVVQDGGIPAQEWGVVSWTGNEPQDTAIGVEARAADALLDLPSETFIPVTNGVEFALLGRYIEVRARLTTDRQDLVSPVLYDLTICTANQAPVCDAGGPYTAQCAGATTTVQLTAAGSSDPDGDPLYYTWSSDCPGAAFDSLHSATPVLTVDTSCACAVDCNVTLIVSDGRDSSTCTAPVAIRDTTPPVLVPRVTTMELWPPNHQYRTIEAGAFLAGVRDACDQTLDLDDVVIESVHSDEAENAPGAGDGNTLADIVIECPNRVLLRAERQGDGAHNGRVYTITYLLHDTSGNEARFVATVGVPHSQNGTVAIDGPDAGYTVNTCTSVASLRPRGGVQLSRVRGQGVGITFAMDEAGPVQLQVYDIAGRLIRRDGWSDSPGVHTAYWNGRDGAGRQVAAGVYFFRVTAGTQTLTAKGVWAR